MHRRVLFILTWLLTVGSAGAQQPLSVKANLVSASNNSTSKIYYGNRNDPARAIEFKEKTVASSTFLVNINQYFTIPAEFTFIEVESNTDNLGMRHRFMQQYYKGIPMEGLGYRVHEKDGFMRSANGRAVREIKIDIQTTFTEEAAFQRAINHLNTKDSVFRIGKKLIISKDFTFTPESFSIAFQFDIDVSLIERWRISIDARDGQVINKISLVNSCHLEEDPKQLLPFSTGTGLTNYYGNKTIRVETFDDGASRLQGQTEHGGKIGTYDFGNVSIVSLILFFEFSKAYDFYSSDNIYNSEYLKPAVSVQWAAEQAYEYYFNKHNRNSFDNNGATIKSYVHVDRDLNNAFWTGKVLAFGDGSNNNPLVELDVVSHELTHGVTQYEAGLLYYNESGALNESFSDIFAKAVEFDVFGDTATWQLAKYFRNGGLRDFSNPKLKNQPDTYLGAMWYTGYENNGGVHTNSGVQNFWYYLLCEGGSGTNDQQMNYSVNAIGMDAATKIAYRNLTEYLNSTSDYLDSRIGSLLAAADLYGKNSSVYQEVDKAWDAVGVIDEPIITSLEVYDITGTTVKIKGSLQPRGDMVTYHFEYGTTPVYGSSSSVYNYTGTVEGILTGLQSETKYYLKLVGTNENGSTFSAAEFTTISLAPLVRIKQTVDVTETTATLYGEINPNSLLTSFYFEYGPTPALGLVTPTFPLSAATEFLHVSAEVTELQSRQIYYYRLIATNGFAPSLTESVSFFTAVRPVIISYFPVMAPIDAEVTITGQNFNSAPEKNIINFGATRATVVSSSTTEIKVKVPAGASFGAISVLDSESGLTAESVREFVPTFTGEFKKNSLVLTVGIADMYIYQTLVHDMDGDGKPDIVARHYQGFSVYQNVNQGGDITEESFVRSTFNSEITPGTFSLVDFDGNGLKDIVARYGNGFRIYPNLSVPGYIFFGSPIDLPNTGFLQDVIFGDFDMDGHFDIAGTSSAPGGSTFTIFRNQNPKGSLLAENFEQRYTKTLPYNVFYLTSGDLNNDRLPDVMAAPHFEDFFSILKNKSYPGVFEFEETIVQDPSRGRFARYVSHDFDDDGLKDVISQPPIIEGSLSIMKNEGTSPVITLAPPAVVVSGYTASAIQPGDINGDGIVDLVVGTNMRDFFLLENKGGAGVPFSNLSFEKSHEYGMTLQNVGSGSVSAQKTINDLNGDGKPEIINAYSYSFGPHDGYYMEIWQHSANNCPDPSLVNLTISNYMATIVLPPNTTEDDFQIEYSSIGDSYWHPVYSLTLYLNIGRSYQLRARAKCYLGFTEYHYIDFAIDCVDTNSFSISDIGVDKVSVSAYNLQSFEVQYSQSGKDQWKTLPEYANQIEGLLPGTTYDVRFRGRWCYTPAEFKYEQFTTLCPKLSTLTILSVVSDKANVNWTSAYNGDAILEYSADNENWSSIDESLTLFPLIPATTYFIRGRMACTNINSDFIFSFFVTPCPELSMLSVDTVTPFSANITWVDKFNTDSYVLTYSTTAASTQTTEVINSTSFQLNGLNPGTQYTVGVAPQCSRSKAFTFLTFNTVCYVPFDLSADAITHTSAQLSWDDDFSGVPYLIDYSISGSNIWLTTESELTNASLTGLRPGTEYEARVHINCVSETAPYVSVRFKTDLYDETTFGPNPTGSIVTLKPSKNLIGNRFIIFDNAGRVVANGELRDYSINFSDFSAGTYTLKIDGENPMRIVKH